MKVFPLMRVKWSNEHIMAAVLFVLVMYHLPLWSKNPAGIVRFLLLVAVGLFIDCIGSLIRYKKIWCCVSAAVTAAIISLLTSGVPLWAQLLSISVALLLGKQVWGGTGKNIINPAMFGLLPVMLFFQASYPFFSASMLLLPAILFSVVFLKVRPFAGIGIIVGMLGALYLHQDLTVLNIISSGVIFWGCMIITDPVTVTDHPVAGLLLGFLAGFGASYFEQQPIAIVIGILGVNLFSAVISSMLVYSSQGPKARIRIPKVVSYRDQQVPMMDLSSEKDAVIADEQKELEQLSTEYILERIKTNKVFGMGGAAFSAYQKLITVLAAKDKKKYLIINGVECDPGLIHDTWILRNHNEEIQKGVALLHTCLNFQSIYLAVKDKEGINYSDQIEVHQVPNSYPMGAEKILIKEVLKQQIPYDQIPAVNGILVLNVQTVYAIYQAVIQNKQAETRYLTVANLKAKTAKVVKVSLGMKIQEVMEAVYPGVINIFAGGGMMQAHLTEEEDVIDNKVNFLATGMFPTYKESPQCSKCGACSRSCPSGLKVNLIADLVDQGKLEAAIKFHPDKCIACASCSYSCLAGRNLAFRVKTAKDEMGPAS
jgi:ferredoxin/Na+-translocating ferredoxin:NAD+ oxidoreductase RnfD subunit